MTSGAPSAEGAGPGRELEEQDSEVISPVFSTGEVRGLVELRGWTSWGSLATDRFLPFKVRLVVVVLKWA